MYTSLHHNVLTPKTATPFSLPDIPYAHFIRRLPLTLGSSSVDTIYDILGEAFLSLLDLAITAIRHDPDQGAHPKGPPSVCPIQLHSLPPSNHACERLH